jgi:putative endonuclease
MFPMSWARRLAARLRGLPPRPRGSRGAGYDWERTAEKTLRAAGYAILERNFRSRSGEIDFVAEEDGVVCFIEVKGRSGVAFGLPAEAVTAEKRRRIFRAAESYLQKRRGESPVCRFDVVAILEKNGEEPRIEILRDAFRGPVERMRRR